MAARSPFGGLDPKTWWRLLALATLLDMVADLVADLHERSFSSNAIRTLLGDLQVAAQNAALTATNDTGAVKAAYDQWFVRIDQILAGPATDEADRQVLSQIRARALPTANPIAVLFDNVAQLAAEVYQGCWQSPKFDMGWLKKHPRIPPDPYALSGFTTLVPELLVEINVYLTDYGAAAHAALPWIVVHEYVCHVPAHQGGKVNNGSPFAEGFLDWAAGYFFDLWMPEINPRLAPAASQHRRDFDAIVTRPDTVDGAARRRGRRAAERLVVWLITSHSWTDFAARVRIAKLIVDLNCAEAPLQVKDDLVTDLNGTWDPSLVERLTKVLIDGQPAPSLL